MKIPLDECLPIDFGHSFPEHETHSAEWAGFKGQKNGSLLRAAETAGYQAFLTVDHGIPYQQPAGGRTISIVMIRCATNRLEYLIPLAGAIRNTLKAIQPGDIEVV